MKLFKFIFVLIFSVFTIKISAQNPWEIALKTFINDPSVKNAHVGIHILDVAGNKTILNHQADHYFIPASNTKLFSLYAGLKYLGDSLTGLLYKQEKDTLFITPTADPTFLTGDYPTHPVDEFLKKNKKPVQILYKKNQLNKYGKGWTFDDKNYYYSAERSPFPAYGNVINIDAKADSKGIFTTGNCSPELGYKLIFEKNDSITESDAILNEKSHSITIFYPKNENTIKTVIPFETEGFKTTCLLLEKKYGIKFFEKEFVAINKIKWDTIRSQASIPFFKMMMHRSDNMYAEHTLLMAGFAKLGMINDTKTIEWLLSNDLKDLPQKPQWVDGSGLSRNNLFSPMDMTTIILKMQKISGWEGLKKILATGGEGTLKNYFLDSKGKIYAKTGTLSNNVSLTGFIETNSKKMISFSIMVNNHPGKTKEIRAAMEKLLKAIITKY